VAEPATLDHTLADSSGAFAGIERVPTAVTAFVGRCLRGPVNEPVTINSFGEFQQHFGGLWQPSTLSYAVEQYFDSGGRVAIIVRVTNAGAPPTLTLPARGEQLRLRGVAPGSREYLRAAVDYDGIAVAETDLFNLTVQRVRNPGTEQIDDQEIFRRISILPDAERSLDKVLAPSRLVRLSGPLPTVRPDKTAARAPSAVVGYVDSNADGDDGGELSDYDVIGSAEQRSGLFALEGAPQFSLLCIPPLSREQDVGVTTQVVAARLCSRHQAMLIADPPANWDSAETAIAALRGWPFQSADACMYFPRLQAFDRLRGRYETFAPCGAAAGALARSDETTPLWAAVADEAAVLRPLQRPAVAATDSERERLAHLGVNTLLPMRGVGTHALSARTMVPDTNARSDWRYLSVRRLALFIEASVLRGTRWALLERATAPTWTRVRAQVEAFLESLDQEGAFVGGASAESYFVICDDRLNGVPDGIPGAFRLLYGFAALRPGEFRAFLVTHRVAGSSVTQVSVNRLFTAERRVEEEIETAILRGLGCAYE